MGSSERNSVIVTSPEQLKMLIQFSEKHVPTSLMVISGLKRALQFPDLNYKIFCFYDKDPVGILVLTSEERATAVLWASDDHLDIFEKELRKLDCWNKIDMLFQGLPPNWIPCLRRISSDQGGENDIIFVATCYSLPLEKALNMDTTCPSGSYLKALEPSDSRIVHDFWEASDTYPFETTLDEIQRFPSVGLYRKEDRQLVSWITTRYFGYVSRLFTLEEYRGRGYAKVVISYLCKVLAQNGDHPFAFIEDSNERSRKCFTALGFQPHFPGSVLSCSKPTL